MKLSVTAAVRPNTAPAAVAVRAARTAREPGKQPQRRPRRPRGQLGLAVLYRRSQAE